MREWCWRCRRPQSACWCDAVPSLRPKLEVVIVQHPRERKVAIGTARMVHLALEGSRLVEGLALQTHPALKDVVADVAAHPEGTVLLFPDDDALPLSHYVAHPPRRLIVVDGTWVQAKKLITENPWLAALPRLSFSPEQPGRYRIRKEPSDLHLSTVEAVAAVVGAIEGDLESYQALLRPFDAMVDFQVQQEQHHTGERTKRQRQRRRAADPLRELRQLLKRGNNIPVLLYAEANAHPQAERAPGAPEVVHLIASRPFAADPAPLEIILRPRRPLHPSVPERLGLEAAQLAGGVDVDTALRQFHNYLHDGQLLCWGAFARDLIAAEGASASASKRGFVDLRALASRTIGGPAGGVDGALERLQLPAMPDMGSRASRMHVALTAIARDLGARAAADPGPAVDG